MSAEIPLGAIRTYARLDAGRAARRSPPGRTPSGPAGRSSRPGRSSTCEVDGCGPGDVIRLGRGGRDGRGARRRRRPPSPSSTASSSSTTVVVVAASSARGATDRIVLDGARHGQRERLARGARDQHGARSARPSRPSMGAHSSPVYLDVGGQRPYSAADAAAIGTIIDGARTWVETIAPIGRRRNGPGWPEYLPRAGRPSTRSTGRWAR